MTSFSRLVTDVGVYTDRDDLGTVAPSFVTMAEELIAEDIRVRAMTTRSTLTGDGTRFVALPDDYLDLRRLEWGSGDPHHKLIQIAPEAMANRRDINASGAKPSRYCILDAIEFDAVVEDTAQLDITYWAKFAPLNETNETNWLVENAYGVYLYATLLQTAPYLRDPEAIPIWQAAYQQHVASLSNRDKESRVGSEPRVIIEGAELLP